MPRVFTYRPAWVEGAIATAILGEAFVELKPEVSKFSGDLKKKLEELGPAMKTALGVGGIAVAVGATLLAIGEKFEAATNIIIQKTGATGESLKSLEGTTKSVYGGTTASLKDVASATSILYDKTKLLGPALSDLTTKQLNLAKITKTDVNANVQDTAAIFGQFGVAAKDQSRTLDTLYNASKVAGVGISEFDSALKTAAPTAKIMGLNVDQAAAIVSKLTQLGLPASKVMMGLSSEFAKAAKGAETQMKATDKLSASDVSAAAKADSNIAKAKQRLADLTAVQSAKTSITIGDNIALRKAQDAVTTAVDAGAAAHTKLSSVMAKSSAAIAGAGGPVDVVNKMVAAIKAAPNATDAATLAIGKFGIGARQAATLVAAVRSGAFDFGKTLGDITNGKGGINETTLATLTLGDKWKLFAHQSENALQPLASRFLDFAIQLTDKIPGAIAVIKEKFDEFKPTLESIVGFVERNKTAFEALAAAIALVVLPIPTLIAGFVVAYNKFEGFRTVVDAVARFFKDRFGPDVMDALRGVTAFIEGFISGAESLWRRFGGDITAIARTVWATISDGFRTLFAVVVGLQKIFVDIFTGKWQAAFKALGDVIATLGGFIVRQVGRMFQLAGEATHFLLDAIVELGPKLLRGIGDLVVKINDALAGLALRFVQAGADLIAGMIQGIASKAGDLLGAVKNAVVDAPQNLVHALLGQHSPSTVYAAIGHDIMAGLAQGITSNGQAALGALRAVPLGVPGASAAGSGTAGNNQLVGLLQAIRANTDPNHPGQQQTKQLLTAIATNTNPRATTGAPATTNVAASVAFQVAR